ncbi:MAG TPA: hypothetical protein VL172_01630 [Kofleriaceae bacterium]|jgi:hypothetical protein|nr:hypothetical protein [Kofleriaceae bacterium]
MRSAAVLLLALTGCQFLSGKHTRPPDRVRKPHVAAGAGGYSALTGPRWGPVAGAHYFPAGGWGRFGVRAEARGYQGVDEGDAVLGVAFEAAAARPRLVMMLNAGAGSTLGAPHPVVQAGITTQLFLYGPLALALDGGGVLIIDGTDTVLGLGNSFSLQLAW